MLSNTLYQLSSAFPLFQSPHHTLVLLHFSPHPPHLPLPHPTPSVRHIYVWGKEANLQVCRPAALPPFLFLDWVFKHCNKLKHLGVTSRFSLQGHVSDLVLSRRFGLFRKDVEEGGSPSPTDWACHFTVYTSRWEQGSKQWQCCRIRVNAVTTIFFLFICNFGLVLFIEMSVVQFPDW